MRSRRRQPAVGEVAVAGLPDPEAPRAWARPLLGPAQLPKRVVLREALPIGPTGKVLRRVLIEGD